MFEGADCAGKSTQCIELYKRLRKLGIKTSRYCFPTRFVSNPLSKLVATHLSGDIHFDPATQYLLFTAERFSVLKDMVDDVEKGTTVLVDRYIHSGIAYGCARGLPQRFCKDKEKGLLQPDLVIYLNNGINTFLRRCRDDNEFSHQPGFQQAVLDEYIKLVESNWLTFDSSSGLTDISSKILERSLSVIESVKSEALCFY